MKLAVRILVAIMILLTITFFFLKSSDMPMSELKELYANAESEYMDIEGIDVHYRVEGNGQPLVLVHGTGASLHTWDGWVAELQDSFTIYRLDLPAFGLTGPTQDRDYSIENYVSFVHDFTTSLGLDSFALAGNSLGGNISWRYALEYPQRVNHLVLIDASGIPLEEPTDALAMKIAQHPILSPLMRHITPKSFVRKNLEQVYGDENKITDDLVSRYYNMTLRPGNRQAFIDRANTLFTDQSDYIKNITCPTLVVWGEDDTWVPISVARKFMNELPQADIVTYEGVGHVPMEEIPEQTARDVEKWIYLN